jgi:hypothetical protein
MRTTAAEPGQRQPQWTLRSMLLLFIPLSAGFAWYGHVYRQRQQAVDAYVHMCNKGVDANFARGLLHSVFIFKNANVTDADLNAFVPAFNGYAPRGSPRIETIRLKGSLVSNDALERFRRAVPDCKVER